MEYRKRSISIMASVTQTLEVQYIDGQALLALLTNQFGKGSSRIDLRYTFMCA